MTKQAYLQELRLRLSHRYGPKELERLMSYYTEYLDEAGPDGAPAVMAELGTPEELVRRIAGEEVLPDAGWDEGPRRSGPGAVWKVVLAICAAPIAIPLMAALVALALALVTASLVLVAGVAVAGVACVGAGVFAVVWGFGAILARGIATTMFFGGGGFLAAGIGLLLTAGAVGLAGLSFQGIAGLLRRALNRGEARV